MRYKVCLTVIPIFLFLFGSAQNKSTTHIHKSNDTFFQGTKLFCCIYRKTKYRLFIKGNEIEITAIYNGESMIKGVIKNGKIYSNDPMEKNNKMLAGKVYILNNNTFRILTSEGGEYDEFTKCK
jgi:hypothetical protein